jgi:hypothetical protein
MKAPTVGIWWAISDVVECDVAIPTISGASSSYSRLASYRRRNLPDADGSPYAQTGEGVDERRAHVQLGHFPLKGSGVKAVPQLIQPIHHVLGKAAPLVTAIVLPAGAAHCFDAFENGVTEMIVAAEHSVVPRGTVARASVRLSLIVFDSGVVEPSVRLPRLPAERSYSDQFVTRYRWFGTTAPVPGLAVAAWPRTCSTYTQLPKPHTVRH